MQNETLGVADAPSQVWHDTEKWDPKNPGVADKPQAVEGASACETPGVVNAPAENAGVADAPEENKGVANAPDGR